MMKINVFLVTLFTMLASTTTLASTDLTKSPSGQLMKTAINTLEDEMDVVQTQSGTAGYLVDGLLSQRIARVTYDTAVDGGGIGAHLLGVSLPANSIIEQAFFYTNTQFTDAGSGTVALHCEDANNIYSAADVTGIAAGATTTGAPTGSAATMVKAIAAACEITATVATATQTAGKLNLFLRYSVHD